MSIQDKMIRIDRHVTYHQVNDLSVTYGTIFDAVRRWIKHDLRGVVDFKHEFVNTQLQSDKNFFWNTGVLAQARRPTLNLGFEVDHGYVNPAYAANTTRNLEAALYLDERGLMYRVFAYEDKEGNSLECRMAFKNAHILINSGMVVTSRPMANNITQFWHTRRNDDFKYDFKMYVDFKIPEEFINMIAHKYKINRNNHHVMLRFLNKNSFVRSYYGMSGYDGKMYYFWRYPSESIITVGQLSNPQAWDVTGYQTAETYTLERTFELDVMVPMYLAFSNYGDRINLEEYKTKPDEEVHDIDIFTAAANVHERIIEVERVFDEKHLYKEIAFTWTKEDLLKHPSGTITTKKISLEPFLEVDNDPFMKEFLEWAKTKEYNYGDIFNFQLFENPGLGIKNIEATPDIKKTSIKDFEEETVYATIPNDNEEYAYYIKNLVEFIIVDLKPKVGQRLYGELYMDLAKINQFLQETNVDMRDGYANDDLGIFTGYGRSKGYSTDPRAR